MATYKQTKFDTSKYHSFRPTYPDSFYEYLIDYHEKGILAGSKVDAANGLRNDNQGTLLDVGSGTGIVALPLSQFFKHTIVSDPSSTMISQAEIEFENLALSKPNFNTEHDIKFKVINGEQLHSQIEPNSVDVLTAAECVHWMSPPDFLNSAYTVLKPGGTLAYWLYCEPVVRVINNGKSQAENDEANAKANAIFMKYVYDDPRYMGSLWDKGKPEYRKFLKRCNELVFSDLGDAMTLKRGGLPLPTTDNDVVAAAAAVPTPLNHKDGFKNEFKFTDVQLTLLDQLHSKFTSEYSTAFPDGGDSSSTFESKQGKFYLLHDAQTKLNILPIEKSMKFEQFKRYIDTYSALHTWRRIHKSEIENGDQIDMLKLMFDEYEDQVDFVDDTDVVVTWDSMVCLARKV
ncbi:unnamed protein product [Ambrosiozyma monospora]|uniref:Unnamed protein product n=1 Tax=Ambrosiozyma monospora TaxID=43982 RepID=A0A9W7DIL0_AMBMO|nr:unnamed protein product [Ambrosiozyma monospora]